MSGLQYIEYSVYLCIWTLIIYLLIVNRLTKSRYYIFNTADDRIRTTIFWLSLLFCTTCFCDGDNFHYTQWIKNANTKGDIDPFSSAEPFYQYLSYVIDESFFLFRLVVWGGSLLFFSVTARRLEIKPSIAQYLLYTLFLVTFSTSRMTLAMVMYFFGLSFLIRPGEKKTIYKIILGLVIIVLSRELHRSVNALLALTPIIFIPNIKNNKIKMVTVVGVSIVTYFATYFIAQNMGELLLLTGDESVVDKYNKYAIKDVEAKGLGAGIFFGLRYFILWGVTIMCYIHNQKHKESLVSYNLFKFSFLMLLFALIFRTIPDSLPELAKRIDEMATIPVTLLLGYSVTHYNFPMRKCNYLVRIGLVSNLYKIVYYLYLLSMGQGISHRLMV